MRLLVKSIKRIRYSELQIILYIDANTFPFDDSGKT